MEHEAAVEQHQHPGRQCRSVSFDNGKHHVIDTDPDPDVDPSRLRPIVGRPPTPRPSRTDFNAAEVDESAESSRPQSCTSQGSLSSTASEPKPVPQLNPEMLVMRLTVDCAPRTGDKEAVLRERGEGVQDTPTGPEKDDLKNESSTLEDSNSNMVAE
ncbi:uncharacterized protein LOC135392657 isoform X2 [Ornithodoros turicata]|uniref:uncharacterized protein LOC135392657 isoform X2 n=1 Tax=Ornithodoros turicata TaxID=34597 RepID=UPI00313917FF